MTDQANTGQSAPSPSPAQPNKPAQSAQQIAPAQQTQSPPSGKSGGSKVLIIVIIVIVVLAILGIIGGRIVSNYLAKKAGEKVASSLLSGALGGNASVSSGGNGLNVTTKDGTISTGDKAKWPSDMPSAVPEFKYGTLSMSTKVKDDAWSVMYEKVNEDSLTKYEQDLAAKGWAKTDSANLGFADTLMMTNDNNGITVIYDPQSKGISLSVAPKSSS